MLDANLEWGVAGSAVDFDTVEAMARLMGAYEAEFDSVVSDLQSGLEAELGDAAPLFELTGDAPDTGLGRLSDTMLRVEGAVDAVIEEFRGEYQDLIEATVSAQLGTIHDDVHAVVVAWNTDVTLSQITAAFDADDLLSAFGSERLMNGTQDEALIALIAGMDDAVVSSNDDPPTQTNLDDMFAAMRTALSDAFTAETSEMDRAALMVAELADTQVDGQTVVAFTQGATTADVSVTITLPDIETGLDALGHHPDLRMPLPVEFDFTRGAAGTMSFDLTAQNALADATPGLGLTLDNVSADHLFELGDPAGTPVGQDVSTGFLSGTLDEVATAGLRLGLDWAAGGSLDAFVGIDDSDPEDDVTNTLAPTFDFEIQEIGAAAFADVVDANSYALVQFDVTSELQFGIGATSLASFDTTLTVSGNLGQLGQADTTAALFDAATGAVVFDTSGIGAIGATQQQVADLALTLFDTTSDTFTAFLAALGAGTANLLSSDQLSVGIPFTDIDVMDGFGEIADLFGDLAASFAITPGQLGFDATNSYAIELPITQQEGIALDTAALLVLANLQTLDLEMLVPLSEGAGTSTQETSPQGQAVTVDFSTIDPFDADGVLVSDFLDQIAQAFTDALSSFGWAVQAINGALRFTATAGLNAVLFKITGDTERDGDQPTDTPFDFASFGFTDRMLRQIDAVAGGGVDPSIADTFDVLNLSIGRESVDLGVLDLDILQGLDTLRLAVSVDGVPQLVDIDQPNTGWGTVDDVAAAVQSEFAARDIGITVTSSAVFDPDPPNAQLGNGLTFTHSATDDAQYTVGLDASSLARVTDLQGLLAWVNDKLSDVLPGATLDVYIADEVDAGTGEVIARAGDIRLTVDPIERNLSKSGVLGLDDLGLGNFEGLKITAALQSSIDAALEVSALFNIYDLQADYAAQAEDEKSVLGALLDNAKLTDMRLTADFSANADALTGGAELGLMEIGLGLNTPTDNFAAFDATLDVTVVGEDDGAFGPDVSFAQFVTIFGGQTQVGTDDMGDPIFASVSNALSLANLIGRFDLTGNIVIDEDGCAVTEANSKATTRAALDIFDEDTETLDAGESRAMVYFGFGDLTADLGGIDFAGNLGGNIGLSIGNIFDPFGTAKFCADLPDLDCLVVLTAGAVLDGLAGLGDLLDSYSDQLASQLAFMTVDIPLLNASVLDGLDFTSDFLAGIDALRNDPDFSLSTIEALLQETFGGMVSLTFEDCVLQFDMQLAYLTDYSETLGFNVSLTDLMSQTALEAGAGDALADILTNLVDARGDAELVFDPDIFLELSFGLDLSEITPTLTTAEISTPLDALAGVYTLRLNDAAGASDLRVVWEDMTDNARDGVNVDLTGAETISDVIDRLNAALSGVGSGTVSASYDAAAGQIVISDSNTNLTDDAGVTALFGATSADSDDTTNPLGEIALDAGLTNYAGAYAFDVVLNGGGPVTVSLAADTARTTIQDFAAALNAAMLTAAAARTDISGTGIPLTQVSLFQLLRFKVDDGGGTPELRLEGTNFAEINGFDPISFTVQGVDTSHDVSFTITQLDNSNAADALGFASGVQVEDTARSGPLFNTPDIGRPILFVDTGPTGTHLRAEVTLGAPDGLNLVLALGPVEAAIEGGQAFIGSSAGDAGFVEATILDVDGVDDGRLDLVSLVDIANDPDRSFLDLFGLEVDLATNIELPFSGAFGLLNPALHGFTYQSAILETVGPDPITFTSLRDLVSPPAPTNQPYEDAVRALFQGDAIELYFEGTVPDSVAYDRTIELRLPDLSAQLDCSDIFELLNNPNAILNGLDMVFSTIQSSIETFLGAVDLPIIGENLMLGANFFRDLQFDMIDPARDWVAELNADGSVRTTADLVEVLMNEYLNKLYEGILGLPESTADKQFIQLESSPEGADDPFIYGGISFDFRVFEEALNIGFDLDIPGLDLGVDDASAIVLTGDLFINLGFGLDCNGFFILNDTDEEELRFVLKADAGGFQGLLNLSDILGFRASAGADDAYVEATIGIDLFGDAGEGGRDYGGLSLAGGATFDTTIYATQLDFGNFAEFTMHADVHLELAMEALILDPIAADGSEFKIGGNVIFPSVLTTFEFDATYDPFDPDIGPTDLLITNMKFSDVRIDVKELYDGLLAPVFDPILDVLGPLQSVFSFLNEVPFSYAVQAAETLFPIIGLVDSIVAFGAQFSGGEICLGTYDFLGYDPDGQVLISQFNLQNARFTPCYNPSLGIPNLPELNAAGPGLIVELPLLTDPMQAFRLLTGDFAMVDLVTVEFLLLDADFEIDFARDIVESIGLPGWAASAIRSAFNAYMSLDLYAGFSVGYDMSGIVNFANTFDVVRLLDGAYIDSAPGSLISVDIDGRISLNAGIAGASASLGVDANLNFRDPNKDGRLRLAELVSMAEFLAGPTGPTALDEVLGVFFEGGFNVDAALRIWAGINLPWPLPDLTWSTTVFDIGFGYSLPNVPFDPVFFDDVGGGTTMLNVGAQAAASLSGPTTDGSEAITLSGAQLTLNGVARGAHAFGSGGVIIPAGNGNNTVDMTGLIAGVPTVTFAGDGADTIRLANSGVHVVFAGDGADTITANGSGTYIIFAEGGADTINVTGQNVMVISGDDHEMRDRFMKLFSGGGMSDTAIMNALGLQLIGGKLVTTNGGEYVLNGAKVGLNTLLTNFTADTQLNADRDNESITINGAGNHLVLTGSGQDQINVNNACDIRVYSGAGDDQINAVGTTVLVEAGAGADLVVLGNGTNTAWGWGAQGEDVANLHLVRADGDDIMIGGTGVDMLHGQYGRDVISGGLSDDILSGGYDNDLISGGSLLINRAVTGPDGSVTAGVPITLTLPTAFAELQNRLFVQTLVGVDDGTDTISGGDGSDVMFGGAGSDDMSGGASADILVGDYGNISISANRLAETFISTGMTASFAGIDTLDGGAGNDILVAGGSDDTTAPEEIEDLLGNNIIFGDFGNVIGTRILETVNAYRTLASANGTEDSITTGAGNDVILGGERSDTINSGTGADFILGDNGEYVVADGRFETFVSALDGDDSITVGTVGLDDKLDIILGGAGNDIITSLNGGVIALGDYGRMDLSPEGIKALLDLGTLSASPSAAEVEAREAQLDLIAGVFKTMQSTADATSGDDTVSVGEGLAYVILGGGADEATLGDGLTYLVADDGQMTADAGVITAETQDGANAGADSITTAGGRDLILGGDGADTINAGADLNIALTDNGRVVASIREDALPTQVLSREAAGDGADSYTGGGDADFVILGGDSDTAELQDGLNYVLGDNGELTSVPDPSGTGPETVTLRTVDSANTGAETLNGGSDRDVIIGGGGSDSLTTGEGVNAVVADNGQVTARHVAGQLPITVTAFEGSAEGDDTVIGGSQTDLIALGLGSDSTDAGGGANRVLGDLGTITTTGALGDDAIESTSPDQGGDDTIEVAGGADVIVAGDGADSVTSGAGADIVFGDAGFVRYGGSGAQHSAGADTTDHGGDDVIDLGAGNDIAVAGLGNDSITTDEGEDVVMGDLIDLTFLNTTDLESLTLTRTNAGGEDTITADGFGGDNILMGQFGADTILGGTDDDWIIGDLAEMDLSDVANARPNQSAVDRITRVEHGESGVAFDDVLAGGDGADFLLGGYGADLMTGGLGQDFLFGDTILLEREILSGGVLVERIELETNLPFVTGGIDTMNGGDGPDVLIGGLGKDLFIGNTEDDILIGDSFAGKFTATLPLGFIGPTPERELVTGNFPGLGPIDILSGAQYRSAIGVFFSTTGFFDGFADIGYTLHELDAAAPRPAEDVSQFSAVLGFFQATETLERLAMLLQFDTDPDLVEEEAYRAFLVYMMATGAEPTPLQLELFKQMLQRVQDQMETTSVPPTAPTDSGAPRAAA